MDYRGSKRHTFRQYRRPRFGKSRCISDRNITGKVYHVNEIVDEATRSVKVLIECDNPDRKLKPGMYATVNFSTAPVNSIMIPVTALMQKTALSMYG